MRLRSSLAFWSAENGLLGLLLAVNAVSIFGFVAFTLNPQTLAQFPEAVPFYSISYPFFARLQIALAFVAIAVALAKYCGGRWLMAAALLSIFSAASELLGTSYGIPFGAYSYTELLGPKILGKVPYLIPLSWFFMAVPSYDLAIRVLPNPGSRTARVILASLLLLSWDLTLDPAMSFLTPFWIWGESGAYYGMPILNLVGWFITGLILMGTLERLRATSWLRRLPPYFLPAFYAVNLFLPVGMCLAAGLFPALGVTLLVGLLYGILAWRRDGGLWRVWSEPSFGKPNG